MINIVDRETTNKLKDMQSQQSKAYDEFTKLRKNHKDQMKKLSKERNNASEISKNGQQQQQHVSGDS